MSDKSSDCTGQKHTSQTGNEECAPCASHIQQTQSTEGEDLLTPPSTPTLARSFRTKNSLGSITPLVPKDDLTDDQLRKYSWSGRQSPSQLLNTLETEVISACQELKFGVKECLVSELLPHTQDLIFVNLTTLEGQAYCVELTVRGWRVCSLKHDSMNGDIEYLELHVNYFETVYALLDYISPLYRKEFSSALADRLKDLKEEREHDEEAKNAESGTDFY